MTVGGSSLGSSRFFVAVGPDDYRNQKLSFLVEPF
jgi:hypothetical protein